MEIAHKSSHLSYRGFDIYGFDDGSFDIFSDNTVLAGKYETTERCQEAIDEYFSWEEWENAKC